jgi:carbon monoxide dehydrogenase subunit G
VAHISGNVRIAAPLERVFDTVADSRNEPSFNPAMTDVELITAPPVRAGTTFLAHIGRSRMEMLVEVTEYERPHRFGSRTLSSMMDTTGAVTLTAEGEDTILTWDWQVRLKGTIRALGPVFPLLGGRMERKTWTGLKQKLENEGHSPRA